MGSFERYYLPHASFLQPVRSLTQPTSESTLLFWTIILVSSQFHEKHSSLYEQLFFQHRELLKPLYNTALFSAEDIHALLLLCLWPVPRSQEKFDLSWNYIGSIINACLRMSFHKPLPPGHVAEAFKPFSMPGNSTSEMKSMTWLACFDISTQYVDIPNP